MFQTTNQLYMVGTSKKTVPVAWPLIMAGWKNPGSFCQGALAAAQKQWSFTGAASARRGTAEAPIGTWNKRRWSHGHRSNGKKQN